MPIPPPQVIPMTTDHVTETVALWEQTEGLILTYSDNTPDLTRYFAENPGMSHVAVHDARVVGAILCGHDGRRGYLHHLAVSPDYRNQGIGQALIDACTNVLKAVNIRQCNLFVVDDNKSGRAFWEKRGWSEWPTIRLMSKRLDESSD